MSVTPLVLRSVTFIVVRKVTLLGFWRILSVGLRSVISVMFRRVISVGSRRVIPLRLSVCLFCCLPFCLIKRRLVVYLVLPPSESTVSLRTHLAIITCTSNK